MSFFQRPHGLPQLWLLTIFQEKQRRWNDQQPRNSNFKKKCLKKTPNSCEFSWLTWAAVSSDEARGAVASPSPEVTATTIEAAASGLAVWAKSTCSASCGQTTRRKDYHKRRENRSLFFCSYIWLRFLGYLSCRIQQKVSRTVTFVLCLKEITCNNVNILQSIIKKNT